MTTFRLATPKDAPALKMLNDLFNGENANIESAIAESIAHNPQEIVCVAERDQQLVGFCCGQIFKSMCYSVNYGEITELFVLDSCRRQGIGKGLMTFVEAEFEKQHINDYQLFTGTSNHTAQAFYRQQSYTESPELMFRKRV